jgi:DNA-binding response OmpR family regulator
MPDGYRIAVLESDDLMRELTLQWLGEAGHRAVVVSMQTLHGGNGFDLIIADVASPRSAALLVRALRATHSAPLLLLSARLRRNRGTSKQLARQLGVKAILPKPFSHAELMQAIREVMA